MALQNLLSKLRASFLGEPGERQPTNDSARDLGSDPPPHVRPQTIDEWRSALISKRTGQPDARSRFEDGHVSAYIESLGLTGDLAQTLLREPSRLLPLQVWGSRIGWRTSGKKDEWQTILSSAGREATGVRDGLLLYCFLDPTEWVPHPYAPPAWSLADFRAFQTYNIPDEAAFSLAKQWDRENSEALSRRLQERVRGLPAVVAARCLCNVSGDRAHVAIGLPAEGSYLLEVRAVWKGETRLFEIVRHAFPDAQREFAPPWLGGQRIDVFIPSLGVAIEYQGEQHYRPVEHFGGRDGLKRTKDRDQRKAQACIRAGVTLLEWKFDEGVTEETLARKLRGAGIEWR